MNQKDNDFTHVKEFFEHKFKSDKARFLADAIALDDGGWVKHTQYHWSRVVDGYKLDYWPSRKKWQYRGKIHRGDIYQFIRSRTKP